MSDMTAEQAAEAAKGLTFEKVWAVVIETRNEIRESQKRIAESQKESRKMMEKSQRESQKRIEESQRETRRIVSELSKNIGGLGNSLGKLTEALFGSGLPNKFDQYGFAFDRQSPNVKFFENKQTYAEVDFLLEDGDFAMPVEVKTEPSKDDVDDHLKRIEKIRKYLDSKGDKRKLVGAMAGGIVSEEVLDYAQSMGLYFIVQTGDSVTVANTPDGFSPRIW